MIDLAIENIKMKDEKPRKKFGCNSTAVKFYPFFEEKCMQMNFELVNKRRAAAKK